VVALFFASSRLISANLVAARAPVLSRLISANLVAACEEEGSSNLG
jgi:hypothetical protein